MNISALAIKNPIAIVMLFFIATFIGLLSFYQLKIQQFPDMDLPTISVNATLRGAGPEQMETEVARKIENALAPLDGLKNLRSNISEGSVQITAEFRLEKNKQNALDDVKSAVATIRAQLPRDVQEPIINAVNFSSAPVLAYSISGRNMDQLQLSDYVDNDLTKKLLSIKGIGSVTRIGGEDLQIQVLLDPLKIQSLGLSAFEVSTQLRRIQQDLSSGSMNLGGQNQPIRTNARAITPEDLRELTIFSQSKSFKLSDVATIKTTSAERVSGAYFNAQNVVAIEITRSEGESEVDVAQRIEQLIPKIKTQNPNIDIQMTFNFVEPVKGAYEASMSLLYEGALLAILVVWLFLRDIRATFISAIALPLSILPAFWFMQLFGFSLNVITLLALSLVVGILVDDAIVEVENIERHLNMGKAPIQATIDATQEIGLAVVATTFTLIAVFLPTAFMSGIAGMFFKQFGWTAALAVFASLIVARLLTPLMAAYMMQAKPHAHQHSDTFWMPTYLKMATWCLQHRFQTLLLALSFFVASLTLIPLLPTGFIPPNNNSQTQAFLELVPGSTYASTRQASAQAETLLKNNTFVTDVYTTIGAGLAGSRGTTVNETRKATLTIKLVHQSKRPNKQIVEQQLREALRQIPGVKVRVGSSGSGERYGFALRSSDTNALNTAANLLESQLRDLPGIGSVTSSASLQRTELNLKVNDVKLAEAGISTEELANALRVATDGDFDNALSKFNAQSQQIPIVVKLDPRFKEDLSLLNSLQIPTPKGNILLSELASFEFKSAPALIERLNRERTISFSLELGTQTLGAVQKQVSALPAMNNLPVGVSLVPTGDIEMQQELFANFGLAMLTGVLCIYLVLVLLFKDFLQPFSILMALPLSIGGAFLGLLIAGQSFSMPSLIGLIMLMGIATKNSILLVEYAIVARSSGMARFDALLDACHKRARPIIMTTLAMGAGMLPIAAQWGSSDGSFRAPMAVAVIGGLITSTFLSLLIIPAVYTYLDDAQSWFKRQLQFQSKI